MRRIPFISFLVMIISSCNPVSDYLRKADIAIDAKNYIHAIELINKALAKKKYLGEAYMKKAYCYTELKHDDSAIVVYNQLISFDPNNTLALYNIGLCKFRQQKFNDAVTYFNDALITKGYNPYDTSKSKYFMELTPAGKEILGKQNYPDVSFSEIFYMAGLANYESGEIRKAYTYFSNCISQGYNLGESHYMIALCWMSSNQNEKACKSFEESGSTAMRQHLSNLENSVNKLLQATRGLAIWRLYEYVLIDISLLGDTSVLRIKSGYRIYFHLHIFTQHQFRLT